MRVLGLEPKTYGLKGRCDNNANDEAVSTYESAKTEVHQERHQDNELSAVIEAWPTLPEAVRVGLVAMVKAAKR